MTGRLGPSSGHTAGAGEHSISSWVGHHKVAFFETTFLLFAALNIVDLWTSAVALGRGLDEGNLVVVSLANSLGLGVFDGLAVIKIMALTGGLAAAVIGIRTKDKINRRTAEAVMVFLTLVMLVVSINNFIVLGT